MFFSSREMQRRLIHTKVYYKYFYSAWKETFHKPIKAAAPKTSFWSVDVNNTTCFNECFLFHVVSGRHYILNKFKHKFVADLPNLTVLPSDSRFWPRSHCLTVIDHLLMVESKVYLVQKAVSLLISFTVMKKLLTVCEKIRLPSGLKKN